MADTCHLLPPSLSRSPLQDELKELKQLVGSKIDHGNKMLSMDLVPRDENGSPIDPKTAGVMHLYRAVSAAAEYLYMCYITAGVHVHALSAFLHSYVWTTL